MGAFINKEYVKQFIETGLVDKQIYDNFRLGKGNLGSFRKCNP